MCGLLRAVEQVDQGVAKLRSNQHCGVGLTGAVLIVAVFALSSCQPAEESPEGAVSFKGKLLFEAQIQDLELRSGSHTEGKSPEDVIGAETHGRLLRTPRTTQETTKSEADRSTPVAAAISDYSAFRANDADWILENFSDDNRNEVLGLLASDDARKRTFLIFSYLNSFEIWGEAEWQGYRLVMARYNGDQEGGVVLTFRETPDGWKRTNALREDETFDVIISAFRTGTVEAKR